MQKSNEERVGRPTIALGSALALKSTVGISAGPKVDGKIRYVFTLGFTRLGASGKGE